MFIKKSDSPLPTIKIDNMSKVGLIICTICILALGFISPLYSFIAERSFGF